MRRMLRRSGVGVIFRGQKRVMSKDFKAVTRGINKERVMCGYIGGVSPGVIRIR